MKKTLIISSLSLFFLQGCNNPYESKNETKAEAKLNKLRPDSMIAKNNDKEISCKLTSPELQKRKETVITSLKKQILEKKELPNGYAYKFAGTDAVVDELAEFVKSERSCCSFFTFGLSFSGDGTEAWLNLTGPEGTKEMITDEIGL